MCCRIASLTLLIAMLLIGLFVPKTTLAQADSCHGSGCSGTCPNTALDFTVSEVGVVDPFDSIVRFHISAAVEGWEIGLGHMTASITATGYPEPVMLPSCSKSSGGWPKQLCKLYN